MNLKIIFKKTLRYLLDKQYRFNINIKRFNLYKNMSDKDVLNNLYYFRFGKNIDWAHPKTFNEKMQWLKLYDRKKIYSTMVDKCEAKNYVANIIGKEYIIPTIGIYNNFNDIDFKKLSDKFVIKCTHDSGGLVICEDKSKFNKKKAKKKIEKSLKTNYYYESREWPYKNVKPRIIVEKYLEDKKINELRDYKFFCFNGEPKIMYISDNSHRANQHCCFYDMQFNKLNIKRKDYKEFEQIVEKPHNFNKMIEFSKILSKDIPHVRVDWYEVNGKLYFGELTFYTCSGFIPFETEEWDYKMGEMLELPYKIKE